MHIVDIIAKKRDGLELTDAEIGALIKAYTNDEIADYQMAAWLMAVFLRDMTDRETAALTMAMAQSGKMIDLSSVPGIKVDKHSTGGVADTTTMILAPLVAAAGVPVAKMSGRGLGFTGGTVDKLEAIPGFKTMLSRQEFIDNLLRHNIALTGQTADIAPADGKTYALRDVTATIESIPLIASSIMSKKIAAGADKILLDVKVGSGAFMKHQADAVKLAKTMVRIGELVGRETIAVLTNMDQPLGTAVGNSLEVQEAIEILSGRGHPALREVCLILGAYMLVMSKIAPTPESGQNQLAALINNGQALDKFREFIIAQEGNPDIISDYSHLPKARFTATVVSDCDGYIQSINAAHVGYAAMRLGAGREYKGQSIDLAAGLTMHCRVGQWVSHGQPLATIYANEQSKLEPAVALFKQAVGTGGQAVASPSLILGIVNKSGFSERLA